jgi:NDP-sugar pyrophosphorylase family protein
MQAVVLCGGRATRLGDLATTTPKVLLPVAGRPFLDHLIERLTASGIDRVLLLAGHLADRVQAAADALSTSLTVTVVRDAKDGELLGTGGALRSALAHLDDVFVVTYGDSYLGFDYAAPLRCLERDPDRGGCMATFENRDALAPSNAAVSGGLVVRYDKTRAPEGAPLTHIDYGATALRKSAVLELPEGPSDLALLLGALARERRLSSLEVEHRFFEIGSLEGLLELELMLARAGA